MFSVLEELTYNEIAKEAKPMSCRKEKETSMYFMTNQVKSKEERREGFGYTQNLVQKEKPFEQLEIV